LLTGFFSVDVYLCGQRFLIYSLSFSANLLFSPIHSLLIHCLLLDGRQFLLSQLILMGEDGTGRSHMGSAVQPVG
jgi:hypothetical protein